MNDQTDKIESLLARARADAAEKTSVSNASREFADAAAAEKTFRLLREKLFRIERWNDESSAMTFALFDGGGEPIANKPAAVGDFVRITMPGTGKHDWVKIVDVFESSNETILTVQPTFDPTAASPDESVVSHFFTDESTNNFCLRRTGARVEMYVVGLNEATNTAETKNIIESARNLATANIGHYFGFQTAEWTTFCNNFLENEKATDN